MSQPVHDIQRRRRRKEGRCEKCGAHLVFRSRLRFGTARYRCESPTCDYTRDFEL